MDLNLLKGRSITDIHRGEDDAVDYLVLDDGTRIYAGYEGFEDNVLSVDEQQEDAPNEEPIFYWHYK
jgi:hypothetical protein